MFFFLFFRKARIYVKRRGTCRHFRINYLYYLKNMVLPMTTIDLRGRDLIITPSAELLKLSTAELLDALFGTYLPRALRAKMGRDKRYHFLRIQPIYFSAVKQALRQQQTPFTVAFDERPALPSLSLIHISEPTRL